MNYIRFFTNTFASPDLIAEIDTKLLNALSGISPKLLNVVPDFRHTKNVQDGSKEAVGHGEHKEFEVSTKDMAGDEGEHKCCRSFQKPN